VKGLGTGVDPFDIEGVIDTSGTHPQVGACRDALSDARAASAAFAAMTPTQSFGRITVPLGEIFTIDARGGAVVDIESLTLVGPEISGKVGYGGYHNRSCYAVDFDEPSGLEVLYHPGDQVILNVERLTIGNCSYIYDQPPEMVVNVPGRGPRVHFGIGSATFLNLLAPDRRVDVVGTGDDAGTYPGRVWAKNVNLQGISWMVGEYGDICSTD
jgi:hypothetical protein